MRTVVAHRLWDGEQVVDVAGAGWLWEVVISARGNTIACRKKETVTVSQAWCTTAIMRLKFVSGGIHLAMDMRAA